MSRRRPGGGSWAASIVVGWAVVALNPLSARAEGDGSAPAWLVWRTSAGECSSARSFADKVERRLGTSAEEAARRHAVTIAVELGRMPAGLRGWRADLQVNRAADGSPMGRRSIEQEGASCEALEELASFFATLVLSGAPPPFEGAIAPPASPTGPAESPPPPPPPLSPPLSPPGGPPTVATTPSPAPTTSRPPSPAAVPSLAAAAGATAAPLARWTAAVEAGPIVGVGLLPGVSYGAQASVSLGRPAGLRSRLGLALWPARRSQIDANTGADVSLVMASLGICPILASWTGRVLRGCAGADVGRLSATGVGLETPREQSHAIFDLSAGARLEQVIVGRLFATVEARADVPLLRVRVGYADAAGEIGELFRMPPIAAVGQLNVGWLFSP